MQEIFLKSENFLNTVVVLSGFGEAIDYSTNPRFMIID